MSNITSVLAQAKSLSDEEQQELLNQLEEYLVLGSQVAQVTKEVKEMRFSKGGLFMNKRWLVYALIGIVFGVFDFYYQEFTQGIVNSTLVWFVVAWSVWLVPVIPIILSEVKISKSIVKSVIANILVWCVSVISYYLFIAIKLVFIGQSTMIGYHISNYKDEAYWDNLKSIIWGLISNDAPEWLVVAIVGGLIVGFCISFSCLLLIKIYGNRVK